MKHKNRLLILLVTLLAASLACSLAGGGEQGPVVEEPAPQVEVIPTEVAVEEPAARAIPMSISVSRMYNRRVPG